MHLAVWSLASNVETLTKTFRNHDHTLKKTNPFQKHLQRFDLNLFHVKSLPHNILYHVQASYLTSAFRRAHCTSSEAIDQSAKNVEGVKKKSTHLLQPLCVIFHHMLQALQFLGREIRFHVGGIPLESIGVVLVRGAFATVPVLFWKDERVGALPMLNPVIPSRTGLRSPVLVTAAYVSQESSKENKPKEKSHVTSPLESCSQRRFPPTPLPCFFFF